MKTLLALIALACCFGPGVQVAPQDNHVVPGLPVDNCHYGIIGNTALSTDGIIADLNPQIRIGCASGEQPCTLRDFADFQPRGLGDLRHDQAGQSSA